MADLGYLYEKKDGVAVITLSRPDRLNSITTELGRELNRLFEEIERDREVRVVILTGAPRRDGRPCFCAGHDLKEVAEDKGVRTLAGELRTELMAIEGLYKNAGLQATTPIAGVCEKMESLGKPVIAAVDGVCTGGGIELALSSDIVLASETAEISDMHIKNIATVGGAGAPARLPRAVGARWAKEMIFTGDVIDGKLACQIGLANHVYPPKRLMEEARKLAARLAVMRPEAIRLAKANINAAADMSLQDALRFSYLSNAHLGVAAQQWADKNASREGK